MKSKGISGEQNSIFDVFLQSVICGRLLYNSTIILLNPVIFGGLGLMYRSRSTHQLGLMYRPRSTHQLGLMYRPEEYSSAYT